jgi:hypothetical protein
MEFPPRAQAIVDALYVLHRPLAAGSGDEQRRLTRMMAEQIAFELGPQWGVIATSPTRAQSPSDLACNAPPLLVWRWADRDGHVTGLMGAPLHPPALQPLRQSSEHYFIGVDPVDHLGVSAQTLPRWPPSDLPKPPPSPSAPDRDLVGLLTRVTALEQRVAELTQDVEHLHTRRYVTTIWGRRLISVPEKS